MSEKIILLDKNGNITTNPKKAVTGRLEKYDGDHLINSEFYFIEHKIKEKK